MLRFNVKILLIHIKDLCEAITKIINNKKNNIKVFLITGAINISINEIIFLIRNIMNKKNCNYQYLI